MRERGVLLTGSTGFLGGDLLPRLLASRPGAPIYCLMRSSKKNPLEARRGALLEWADLSADEAERVIAVDGDLTAGDLGLGERRAELAAQVKEIFHTAATTRFDMELEEARRVNLYGVAHLISFVRESARAGGFRRLNHVSTAYVMGESGSGNGGRPDFRNTYEESKWEAERLLDAVRGEVPVTCYRPSIIVGDSRTGRTLHFRVLYEPIKWVYLGGMTVLPCQPSVRLDVVPVDFVCDAILAIAECEDAIGRTYPITSGDAGAISIREFTELAVRYGNEWQREVGEPLTAPPKLVTSEHLETLSSSERKAFEKILAAADQLAQGYLPYMLVEQVFECPETRAALAGTGIVCPPLREYMRAIIRYASEHRYGVRS
jgi:long-chain acyl-CoA synthetase